MLEMDTLVALCKRRGFIYPGSEIYGGFANSYTYGPYGSELKNNIKRLWWKIFVHERADMVGMDGPILLHPRTWEASGHVKSFNDAKVDCRNCKSRHRADHLIEKALKIEAEGLSEEDLTKLIVENKIKCPKCGKQDFTNARYFNLMFQTAMNKTGEDADNVVYLRPETAQAIFTEFKNIVDTMRVKIPFGVAQIGKAFRNEITPGNFIFRLLELEQMEIEYFIQEPSWKEVFEHWLREMHRWCSMIGLQKEHVSEYEHPKEKLSHYSKRTVDIMFDFPFGRGELYGLAYRTDFDLKQHSEFSGKKLEYYDQEKNERFTPHVVEPSFGVDRSMLAVLCDAYHEEEVEGGKRVVMKFSKNIAPVKIAIMPLMKKDGLDQKALQIYDLLKKYWYCEYDDGGSIGKRYRRQDEIGTPFCVTVDYDTLEKDQSVTIRDRDSMKQERVHCSELLPYFQNAFSV